jgi:hypothetical protein
MRLANNDGSELRPMHYEDAIKFLIENIAANPDIFADASRPPNFDVFIPRTVTIFLREQTPRDARLPNDPESFRLPEFEHVWLAFYDAAWELCRRGIFRLGETSAKAQGVPRYTLADGYSITAAGREWLKDATARYIPTAPSRYLQCLENPGKVLGLGFLQRAGEAAGYHAYENQLACCAMCGAAAESALLAIANAKTDDSERVQQEYNKRDGRRNVTKLIFGSSQTSTLGNQFESAFNLLTYWRDEAAHGGPSTITQVQAYDALDRLLRLAFFAWDNWQRLTGKPRPE